jgi:uncharacterized protein (TIGR00375 family)
MLGSKSGFDSVYECFDDLTPHIFAVETGLSSDPPMNYRVSSLDSLTLVSNSDAHSATKLGREANIFNTDFSYTAIYDAIKDGDPDKFLGTYEYFPEEGKYHLDGHRKCGIRFYPEESIKNNGICPVCKKSLTLGVLYRIEELADRKTGIKPEKNYPFYSIMPLENILSEILKVGPRSKKVQKNYLSAIETLGSEFDILYNLSAKEIKQVGIPLLDRAILNMRENKIVLDPGYDGEFGKAKIFKK